MKKNGKMVTKPIHKNILVLQNFKLPSPPPPPNVATILQNIHHTAKIQITDPLNVWVSVSPCADGNGKLASGIMKKWKNGCYFNFQFIPLAVLPPLKPHTSPPKVLCTFLVTIP